MKNSCSSNESKSNPEMLEGETNGSSPFLHMVDDSDQHIKTEKKRASPEELKNFFANHKSKKALKCDICPSSFQNRQNLSRHKRTHTGEKPHKCDHCPFAFLMKGNLQEHVKRIHKAEKTFNCELCSFSCVSKFYLKRHIKNTLVKKVSNANTVHMLVLVSMI